MSQCRPGRITLMIALLLVALATAPLRAADADPKQPESTQPSSPVDLPNRRADPESSINAQTVKQLQLAWKVEADSHVSHAPLLDRGFVFFTDWDGNVYKADARSGKVAWKVKIEEPKKEWVWHGLAGTGAIGEGLLFEASVEGHAFALDLDSGAVRWKVRITDNPHAGNVGELLYHDGLVYIGLSSVEETLHGKIPDFVPSFCGEVVALEAATGKVAWRRALVEPPQNGVGVWSGFALDPQMQALFFATSNNYTGKGSAMSDSIVAVHAKTGEILWCRQVLQNDLWTRAEPVGPDYGFGAGPQLFEAEIDGKTRKLVGAGQKSGVYWVVDRRTGEMVWNHVVGYGGGGGGIDAEASVGDALYVWSNNNFDYDLPPENYPLTVKKLDRATGQCLWTQRKAQPASVPSAGYLTGDLYFVGSLDGKVRAYRTSDGQCVWTSPAEGDGVATSLLVHGDMLWFGTGVPGWYGGRHGGNLMLAYRLARTNDESQMTKE